MGLDLSYKERNLIREIVLNQATMDLVQYFIGLGDDQATAEGKVTQLSTECAAYVYVFIMGNTQAIKDQINASALPFMDQAAKDYIIGQLTVPNE